VGSGPPDLPTLISESSLAIVAGNEVLLILFSRSNSRLDTRVGYHRDNAFQHVLLPDFESQSDGSATSRGRQYLFLRSRHFRPGCSKRNAILERGNVNGHGMCSLLPCLTHVPSNLRNESLRLWPAVPNGVPREIFRGSGGAMIAGWSVLPWTDLCLC